MRSATTTAKRAHTCNERRRAWQICRRVRDSGAPSRTAGRATSKIKWCEQRVARPAVHSGFCGCCAAARWLFQADEELEPAEEEETRSKEAYLKACAGSGDGSASSASAASAAAQPAAAEDPYAYLKADASAASAPVDDDFM